MCIIVVPDQLMSFGGTTEPCAHIELVSIGRLGVEENKALSAVIYKLVQEKLGIPDTRLATVPLSLLPPLHIYYTTNSLFSQPCPSLCLQGIYELH